MCVSTPGIVGLLAGETSGIFITSTCTCMQYIHSNRYEPLVYCAFHKHANSKVQTSPSQLRFSLVSIGHLQ